MPLTHSISHSSLNTLIFSTCSILSPFLLSHLSLLSSTIHPIITFLLHSSPAGAPVAWTGCQGASDRSGGWDCNVPHSTQAPLLVHSQPGSVREPGSHVRRTGCQLLKKAAHRLHWMAICVNLSQGAPHVTLRDITDPYGRHVRHHDNTINRSKLAANNKKKKQIKY